MVAAHMKQPVCSSLPPGLLAAASLLETPNHILAVQSRVLRCEDALGRRGDSGAVPSLPGGIDAMAQLVI
jgi:hypothetical protein